MKNLDKYLLQIQEGFWFSDKTISVDLHKFESGEKDKLLIIGYSGSGKSTLGRKLAKKYKCKYSELDECYWSKKGHDKCCYGKIKMSEIKTVVEGVGIINSYFIDYKNLKQFIFEQPIIILGTSGLISGIMGFKRDIKRSTEEWEGRIEKARKFGKYNPSFNFYKFGKFSTQLNIFRKDRISQKGSIIKIYKA